MSDYNSIKLNKTKGKHLQQLSDITIKQQQYHARTMISFSVDKKLLSSRRIQSDIPVVIIKCKRAHSYNIIVTAISKR